MYSLPRLKILPLACALALSACGSGEEPDKDAPAEDDPALTEALADQIMVDPDLASQNEAGAAGAIASQSGALPPEDNSPTAIAAARSDALALLGGAAGMKHAPGAREVAVDGATGAILTAAARAAASSVNGAKCAELVSYTASWAASLPASFPVYPRGNVQESAGTDATGCKLRVINFTTPVALAEVIDFYYSRAVAAGFKPDYIRQGGDDVLGGRKGAASFMIYARKLPTGRTEVDLITSG
jgi:hypothetical protein